MVLGWLTRWYGLHPRYDMDTLLLRDLAPELHQVTGDDDRVLIYEIQSQYSIDRTCYSLDAIVGDQVLGVLTGRETLYRYVARTGVHWIVTSNSLTTGRRTSTRRCPTSTCRPVEPGGDPDVLDGLRFEKVLTNLVFADPQLHTTVSFPGPNHGERIRVYGDWNPRWSGHHPMWNSVYRMRVMEDPARRTE